jgi:hypothetical protein
MRSYCFPIVLVVGLGLSAQAGAAEPGCEWWRVFWQPMKEPSWCCPNDYTPKPPPPVPCPVGKCGPNDYCPKPMPKVCPLTYKGIDDYCRNPCPNSPGQEYPPWYICGLSDVGNPPKCECAKTNR